MCLICLSGLRYANISKWTVNTVLHTYCKFHQIYSWFVNSQACTVEWFVMCAFYSALFMKSEICEHILFPLIRWSGVTGHAPHAAPGLGAGRSQSGSPCSSAARLLVSRRLAHALLLPALPSDGVHGESQPGATQNGLEQREVGPGAPLPLQAALINTWWPYSYTCEVGATT